MDRILTEDSFSFEVKLVYYFLPINHQTLETFQFYFNCFNVKGKKIFFLPYIKSEFLPPPPPRNDAIGAVTNRYFQVTVESGRVPHGEDSDRLLRETNL